MSTRAVVSMAATAGLLFLTLVTGYLVEQAASSWAIAGVACLKVAIIGVVFLELDRSQPLWGMLLGLGAAGVAFGSVLLMGG